MQCSASLEKHGRLLLLQAGGKYSWALMKLIAPEHAAHRQADGGSFSLKVPEHKPASNEHVAAASAGSSPCMLLMWLAAHLKSQRGGNYRRLTPSWHQPGLCQLCGPHVERVVTSPSSPASSANADCTTCSSTRGDAFVLCSSKLTWKCQEQQSDSAAFSSATMVSGG